VVLVFAAGGVSTSGFLSAASVQTILVVASFVGFVAAGQTFVVLIGGIDLSVPWVLNSAAIVLVTTSLGQDGRAPLAVAAALGLGLLVGLVNGVGVAYLSVPAVVMTLGLNGIMEGLALGRSAGMTCGACGSYAPEAVRAVVNSRVLGVSADLLLWLGVILAITFLLSATTFGRRIYAIGNNPNAAFLAGIGVRRITVVLYMLSGLFAALAGVVLVAYGGQPSLGLGNPFLFQSIAAVVIGGISIHGGRGHYLGVVAGSIILVALVTVLQANNMPEYGRSILYGVTILVILLLYGRSRERDG
jgi:ribose transport system permease protein